MQSGERERAGSCKLIGVNNELQAGYRAVDVVADVVGGELLGRSKADGDMDGDHGMAGVEVGQQVSGIEASICRHLKRSAYGSVEG